MRDFRKYSVWEKAHGLVLEIYLLVNKFPKQEEYVLKSQLLRAAISIPANIAEGCGKNSDPDFARYIDIAIGSLSEVEYFIILSKDLNYISEELYQNLVNNLNELKKMLYSLSRSLRDKNP